MSGGTSIFLYFYLYMNHIDRGIFRFPPTPPIKAGNFTAAPKPFFQMNEGFCCFKA
jgi:hypothetical protein